VEAVEDVDASNELVIVISATRRIAAGEELFLDYALDVDGDDPAAYPCACGSTRCRGTLVSTGSSAL
jgi:SET domain-containing protein